MTARTLSAASERAHEFRRELDARQSDPAGRRWVFVAYDQLTDAVGPLSREDPAELGIVVVESRWKARRRPYHRQKLALVLANLRQESRVRRSAWSQIEFHFHLIINH